MATDSLIASIWCFFFICSIIKAEATDYN